LSASPFFFSLSQPCCPAERAERGRAAADDDRPTVRRRLDDALSPEPRRGRTQPSVSPEPRRDPVRAAASSPYSDEEPLPQRPPRTLRRPLAATLPADAGRAPRADEPTRFVSIASWFRILSVRLTYVAVAVLVCPDVSWFSLPAVHSDADTTVLAASDLVVPASRATRRTATKSAKK